MPHARIRRKLRLGGPFSGYRRLLEAEGIEVKPILTDQLAYAVKSRGTVDELVTEFRRLVSSTLPKQDAIVILAQTDLSMLYRQHVAKSPKKWKSERAFIDPLLELSKYVAYLYLRQEYRESRVCQIPAEYDVDAKLKKQIGWS